MSLCALHSKLASEWPKHMHRHTHAACMHSTDYKVCAHSAYELTHIDMRKKTQSAFSILAPSHSHSHLDRVENFQFFFWYLLSFLKAMVLLFIVVMTFDEIIAKQGCRYIPTFILLEIVIHWASIILFAYLFLLLLFSKSAS